MRRPPEALAKQIQYEVIRTVETAINDFCYLIGCKEQVCDECKLFMFKDAVLKGATE